MRFYKIRQINELLESGIYETFNPDKAMTVADLLKELNLEDKYFGILVNGKKASPDTKIGPTDEVVVLPHIAGGI
ncbi:MAG: MoaD/ThiS family protein [Candidatus Lokiarchaeota archaeon]|nr:MoaD/ThiS family protein [Candidatus Lokiarchaeota archaeon]